MVRERERVEGKGPRRVACSSRRRPEQSRGGSQVQSVCEREREREREREMETQMVLLPNLFINCQSFRAEKSLP